VLAVNKWDLVTEKQKVLRELREMVASRLAQLPNVSVVTVSALAGTGVDKLKDAVFETYEGWNRRIATPALNRWLSEAMDRHTPPATSGRRIKIRYMTQPSARPPTFIAFCSQPDALPKSYIRYLTNSLRETFKLPGVPIRFRLRKGENPYAGKRR
jgi:GTP-binding protein